MIFNIKEYSFSNVLNLKSIDFFIIAVGYENRASHLASLLKHKKVAKKLCIQLVDNPNEKQVIEIKKLGFEFVELHNLEIILREIYGTIIIDYSVMMKNLYATVIKYIAINKTETQMDLYFSYSHAKFESRNENLLFVKSIEPILFTDNKEINGFGKKKLIVSLGYERLSVIGLIENLEINYEDVIVLINKEKNPEHQNFYYECIERNKDFLENLTENQIIEFDFFNFNQTVSVLDSIFHRMQRKEPRSQVIISPMSVKTFSLFSMFHSLYYDNVIFYNVTSVNNNIGDIKYPDDSREPYIYKINKNLDSKISIV